MISPDSQLWQRRQQRGRATWFARVQWLPASFSLRPLVTLVSLSAALAAPAQAAPMVLADLGDLADFSLEQLATIKVTSVSRNSQRLSDAAASIFVITQSDIRRSGATTLPEAMRLAPNLQVARSNARNYAITARGFNSIFSNKMLVLIDGRTVYSPLFSGVFWYAQDVVLEDIDRIEVISGPGASIWGANAVNGVINVITKSAADTQGTLAAVVGSKDFSSGSVRYGGELENNGHYRVYGKYIQNDDTIQADGEPNYSGWQRSQAGFRSDWGTVAHGVTLQGDAYDGRLRQEGTRDIRIAGGNLLARMNRKLSDDSSLRLQAYWDFTERNQPGSFIEHLHTLDLEAQHSLKVAEAHNVTWGGGYRRVFDSVDNDTAFAFLPESFDMHRANVFVQDEIALRDDLHLTAGLKLEDNNYTGVEWMPSLRLAYKADDDHLLWGSVSRAVRVPSRIDRDLVAPGIIGGPNFDSEVVEVLELGYRAQPTANVSYSITGFYSDYDKLRTLEPSPSGFEFKNGAKGRSRGVEMWGSWQARRDLRFAGGLVVQSIDTAVKPGRTDISGASALATDDPDHYWQLRTSYDISEDKQIDLTVRHTSDLDGRDVSAYTVADLRFAWQVQPQLELSIVGQNLFDSGHQEFDGGATGSEFDRAVFLKLDWRV